MNAYTNSSTEVHCHQVMRRRFHEPEYYTQAFRPWLSKQSKSHDLKKRCEMWHNTKTSIFQISRIPDCFCYSRLRLETNFKFGPTCQVSSPSYAITPAARKNISSICLYFDTQTLPIFSDRGSILKISQAKASRTTAEHVKSRACCSKIHEKIVGGHFTSPKIV